MLEQPLVTDEIHNYLDIVADHSTCQDQFIIIVTSGRKYSRVLPR